MLFNCTTCINPVSCDLSLYIAGGITAGILSVTIGEPPSESSNRRRANKNSQTYWFNTTFTRWPVWWVQKGAWMCHLYDWIQCWWFDSLFTVYAYLSCWLYRWLANAKSHVSQLHGTSRCSSTHHLWNMLIDLDPGSYLKGRVSKRRQQQSYPKKKKKWIDPFLIFSK